MYQIFYHADLDGVMSAAIFLAKTKLINSPNYFLRSFESNERGTKFNNAVQLIPKQDRLLIFDYQYHKRANLWIDHHYTKEFGDKSIFNKQIQYNTNSYSAASLVDTYISETYNVDKSDMTMIDMIDACLYPSAEFTFTSDDPYMILRAYMEINKDSIDYNRVVELIARFGVEDANRLIGATYHHVYSTHQKAKSVVKRIEKYGNISVLRQDGKSEAPRYSEFLVKGVDYGVRLTRKGKNSYIQIGYNQWDNKNKCINLGKYIRTSDCMLRGGGHFSVASGIIKQDKIDEFLDEFSERVM